MLKVISRRLVRKALEMIRKMAEADKEESDDESSEEEEEEEVKDKKDGE